MQQLYSTTDTQTEQALPYAPAETAASPAHAMPLPETSQEQQEQSEAVNKLLAVLERDTKKRRKLNNTVTPVYGVCILGFLAITGVTWLVSRRGINADQFFQWIMAGNAIGWLSGFLFLNKRSAAELTTLNDVRCIKPLIDIWKMNHNINYDSKTRAGAKKALTRLLPQLKASDAGLLKEPQRVALRGVLANNGYIAFGKHQDAAFMISILKAFEQVGDWKSLSCVQKLAREAKEPSVRAAAMECLPYLEALAHKRKPGENLLRASSASEAAHTAPDTLLRPALATEEAQPDTLLRPSGE